MKIHNTERNRELIEKDSRLGREKERRNRAYEKEMERVQEDDYLKTNTYSEGFCYGCAKRDKIIQTLIYVCTGCYQRRGKEGLFTNVALKEKEEICDICGFWRLGIWQRNVTLCDSCVDRMDRIHAKHAGEPDLFRQRLRRKYGKDYKILTGFNL